MNLATLIREHKASLDTLMLDWKTLIHDTYFKQYKEVSPNKLTTKLVISNNRYRIRLDIAVDLEQGPTTVTVYSNLIEPRPQALTPQQQADLSNNRVSFNRHWIVAPGLTTVDCQPIAPNELLMYLILLYTTA
jgi:hypothetical protein